MMLMVHVWVTRKTIKFTSELFQMLSIYVCLCVYVSAYIYACVCIYMCAHIYVCVCVYKFLLGETKGP